VQVNDNTAETITLHATSTFGASAEGVSGTFTRSTGSTGCTVAAATCDATKQWADARILLTPQSAINVLGAAHTFTATLQVDTGSGFVTLTDSGDTISFSLPAPANSAFFVNSVSSCTTTAGSCSVDVNDNTAETITVHATSTFGAVNEGVTGTFTRSTGNTGCTVAAATCDATKTWADARITLTPQSATNIVGNAHTYTATLQYSLDGTNWTTLTDSGDTINFSLPAPANSATFVGGITSCTTTAGSCTVQINDLVAETITVHATSTFGAANEGVTGTFTRSTGGAGSGCSSAAATCDATKIWVKPGTTLTVNDQLTGLPAGATGSVTYTAYNNNSCSSAAGGQLFTETDTIVTAGTAPTSQSISVGPGQTVYFAVTYTGSGAGNFGTFTSPCTAETASSAS
jgi:hypothetical protein